MSIFSNAAHDRELLHKLIPKGPDLICDASRRKCRAIAAPIIFSEISFSCITYKSSAVLSVLCASALKFTLLAKPIASSPGKYKTTHSRSAECEFYLSPVAYCRKDESVDVGFLVNASLFGWVRTRYKLGQVNRWPYHLRWPFGGHRSLWPLNSVKNLIQALTCSDAARESGLVAFGWNDHRCCMAVVSSCREMSG